MKLSRKNKANLRRQVRLESLESRQLMAADIDFGLVDNELYVVGTDAAEEFTITTEQSAGEDDIGNGDILRVVAKDLSTGETVERTFEKHLVQELHVAAEGGNDRIVNQSDVPMTAMGAAGDDVIQGGTGNDRLVGGDGDDTIDGGAGNDVLDGFLGDDTLRGGEGNDTLRGGRGDDNLDGVSGNNFLQGGNDDDVLVGGIGADVLHGNAGDDVLHATTIDNDRIEDGGNFLSGGNGDDRIYGGVSNDVLLGGNGDDVMSAQAGNNMFRRR